MNDFTTVKYNPNDKIINVIILIDRVALSQFARDVMGRNLSPGELDNLEVQIEGDLQDMAESMSHYDKEYIEEAIVNDNIPA